MKQEAPPKAGLLVLAPDGALYAMSWFHRDFYKVNPMNAATSLVSSGPHRDSTGMALSPVPEPLGLGVLAIGIVALGRRRP